MAHHFVLTRALGAFVHALPAIVIPALIVAGVLGGVFTITESAGAAALYALVYAVGRGALLGAIPWREIWIAFRRTAIDTGVIMFLLGASGLLAWVLSRSQAPQAMVAMMSGFGKYETLLLINVALLFLGLFLEPAPALLLCTPLFLPMVKALGIDPVHFGIIMVVNLQLGVLSPPVAASAVVTSRIAGISFEQQTNALWPFMGLGVVTLLIVTYIPALSLWVPGLVAR
jgi:C4-dicarboxylate transporter DctM subunit